MEPFFVVGLVLSAMGASFWYAIKKSQERVDRWYEAAYACALTDLQHTREATRPGSLIGRSGSLRVELSQSAEGDKNQKTQCGHRYPGALPYREHSAGEQADESQGVTDAAF